MPHGRRRVLRTVAACSTAAVSGCLDGVLDESDASDTSSPSNTSNATSSESEAQTGLTSTASDLARAVFEDRAYERATEQFTDQARRLFRPVYFEQVRLGATAIAGQFRSVESQVDNSSTGLASVTLDLAFEQSPGQFVVSGAPDALTRAVLDGIYQPPAIVEETAFRSGELTLQAAECELPGTLAIPESDTAVPGAVIVPGDGIIDQDFTTGGTAMYRDLGTGLASNGVATLRYDKRTVACDISPSSTTLANELTDDALTAVERLRTVEGVDPNRIVVIGHSLGGLAAPTLPARSDALAGIVGLATPARPLQQLAITQTEQLIEILEHSDRLEAQLPSLEAAAARVESGEYTQDERLLGRTGSFWDSLASTDHLATAATLSVPQLYLQGSRDFQVDPAADFERLREQVGSSSNSFGQYPGLNHRFMATAGPSLPTEYRMPNNVSGAVIEDIADWIAELG